MRRARAEGKEGGKERRGEHEVATVSHAKEACDSPPKVKV